MIDIPLAKLKERLKWKEVEGTMHLYDAIRRTYVVLQPEELVRQMLCLYLIEDIGYPASRFRLEKGTVTNDKKGRYDILIYDQNVTPWMLIECKSHRVPLTQSVVDQLSGYNHSIGAPYMVVCNGINTMCYTEYKGKYVQLQSLPNYSTAQ